MIRFNHEKEALQFWQIYHSPFMIYFQQEMDQLGLLLTSDQLSNVDFLKSNLFM
jgi:hypothetical protein